MSEAQPDTNHGTSGTLRADGDDGNGKDHAVLLKWENLNIPAGSTVKSATITLNVTNSSGGTYELYELKRSWSETEATWNKDASGEEWQTPGAKGTSDRGTTVLGTVAASSTGKRTVDLNADGVALIQSWVDSPSKNQGFMLYDSGVADGLAFDSREASTVSNRPKLTIPMSLNRLSSLTSLLPPRSQKKAKNETFYPLIFLRTLSRLNIHFL